MKKLLGLLVSCLMCSQASAYVVTTNTGAVGGASSWSIYDGTFFADLRAALANPVNFGAGGVVSESITLNGFSGGTLDLTGSDAFVASWWSDSAVTAQHLAAVQSFFLAGGDVILFQDDSGHDAFGTLLGLSSINGANNPVTVTAPLTGPFGAPGPINQSGAISYLDNAAVLALGGTICGSNNGGRAVMACFDRGVYAPTAGKLIVVTDIDLISSAYSPTPTYAPLDNKGRLGLNLFAQLATPNELPEPSSIALAGLALLAVGATRKKQA